MKKVILKDGTVIAFDRLTSEARMQLGLIDEYRINVHPVVLGNGKPLFKDLKDRIHLKL